MYVPEHWLALHARRQADLRADLTAHLTAHRSEERRSLLARLRARQVAPSAERSRTQAENVDLVALEAVRGRVPEPRQPSRQSERTQR